MALTTTNATGPLGSPAFSLGPVKVQALTFSVANGDTTGTVTADRLTSIDYVQVHGVALTALPTFSGNVATLAYVDPAATRYGSIMVYGR